MSNNYWGNRLSSIADNTYLSKSKKMEQELAKRYKRTAKTIQKQVDELYFKMLEDGEISTTNLYAYGRYTEVMNEINKELQSLGYAEMEFAKVELELAYRDAFDKTTTTLGGGTSWGIHNKKTMEQVVNSNWSGKNFSSRIWDNKSKMIKTLDKNIVDCVAAGLSKDKAVKEVMNTFGKGFSDADRLVRTELMFAINQGQKASYEEKGYTEYEYLAALDDRTSEECEALNGKIFKFSEGVVGVNMPPMHPYCRSTIIPVIS